LQAARKLGLKVPEDLAIIGFDDIPESAFFHPPLSTIRQQIFELGSRAVRELNRRIDASQQANVLIKSESVRLQPELIVRESSIVKRSSREAEGEL
jgi:LacI family transcriptional regulator